MVTTTRARKRRIDGDGNDDRDIEDEEYQQLALALVEAEERRKQTAKKRRKDKWTRNHPVDPFVEMLPFELLPKIFSYLDSVNLVYKLSLLSKSFRHAITPELVVQTAVFQGGNPKQVIERIMKSVKDKSVYIPSIFRLLRLVNATMCERGEECCGYDLVNRKPSRLEKPTHRPFTLSICLTCVEDVSAQRIRLYSSWSRKNNRIESYDCTKLLSSPQVEHSTGDDVGSLVLFKHVKQIEKTHHEEEKRKALLEDRLVQLDQNITQEERNLSQVYVGAFDTAMAQFDAHQKRKRDVLIAIQQAKDSKRASRKRDMSQPVYNKIEELLEGFKYKEIALAGEWNSAGIYIFEHEPSKRAIGPLLSAPSGATLIKITTGVATVQETIMLFDANGLIGDDFPNRLGDMYLNRSDLRRHQKALITCCISNRTAKDFLGWFHQYEIILGHLRLGSTPKALFYTLDSANSKREVFVCGVVSNLSNEKGKNLAGKVWDSRNSQQRFFERGHYMSHPKTFDAWRTKFNECQTEYRSIHGLIKEYKKLPETVVWLKETTPPANQNQTFSRMVSPLLK
jgi:hypothetical protein